MNDELVVEAPEKNGRFAPAHDVLEDWAILQWLDQFDLGAGDCMTKFVEEIGSYPALRRGYRFWLSEKNSYTNEELGTFILNVMRHSTLPDYFRDDTIVAILQGVAPARFLTENEQLLVANDASLLLKFIHLARVSCKAMPTWATGAKHLPSLFLVPSGNAWPELLSIISRNVEKLIPRFSPVILGFLEDWGAAISYENTDPVGKGDAGEIAFALLESLSGYQGRELRERILKVILKVPNACADKFIRLLEAAGLRDQDDRTGTKVSSLILADIHGANACREFPEAIVKLARTKLFQSEQEIADRKGAHEYGTTRLDNSEYFGLNNWIGELKFFPASALRGFFWSLLQHHPIIGLDFVVELANHACGWLGQAKWQATERQNLDRIILIKPDGSTLEQWFAPGLWGAYRGLGNSPYVFNCALMALERRLLGFAELEDIDLDLWLMRVLEGSNNIALSAVVASICVAHPTKTPIASLTLLSSIEFILLDRQRMLGEPSIRSLNNFLPDVNQNHKFFHQEREQSDKLPHRAEDLEALAVRLQVTEEHRAAVWSLLDQHYELLPPETEQTEEHKIIRFALHRMDTRRYVPHGPAPSDDETEAEEGEAASRVLFGPGELEQDLREMVEQRAPFNAALTEGLFLSNWARKALESNGSYPDWAAILERAKAFNVDEAPEYANAGPAQVAAVCLRDHWDELTPPDRDWCIDSCLAVLEHEADAEDQVTRISRSLDNPDRAAALVVPRALCQEDLTAQQRERLVEALALATTHAVLQVRMHAFHGLGRFCAAERKSLVLKVLAATLKLAQDEDNYRSEQTKLPWEEREQSDCPIPSLVRKARKNVKRGGLTLADHIEGISLDQWEQRRWALNALRTLKFIPDDPDTVFLAEKLAEYLAEVSKRDRRGMSGQRHYEDEQAARDYLAGLVLASSAETAKRVTTSIVSQVDDTPEEVANFLRGLISEQDKNAPTENFWMIWSLVAHAVIDASWSQGPITDQNIGDSLIDRLFLLNFWKESADHWPPLEGNSHKVREFFRCLKPSAFVVEAYCRFLSTIGSHSLPEALIDISSKLAEDISLSGDCIFRLEKLLAQRLVREPTILKSNPILRQAIVSILDHLVRQGSSAAYYMRDDFVTPLPVSKVENNS